MFGVIPDYRGIKTAEAIVPKGGTVGGVDATAVAAGIAVQSQWYRKITDTKEGWFYSEDSGIGPAQVKVGDMDGLGLSGLDPEDPDVAALSMAARISQAVKMCENKFEENCTPQDKLIVAALAQNGSGFTKYDMRDNVSKYVDTDGSPDWNEYFDSRGSPSSKIANIRQSVTGLQYDTRFMLKLYITDMKVLHKRGWDLPWGLSGNDLNNIENTYTRRGSYPGYNRLPR